MSPRGASHRPRQPRAEAGYTGRPTGPFGVAMSPRSASHRPRHDWMALRDVSPTQG